MNCASFDKEVPCPEKATMTVFWPGKETVACDRHTAGIQRIADAMGFSLATRILEPEKSSETIQP